MKVLSLFSGVGGFDLGLENAGMETVFQCEWDKHATKILERHWPHVPKWTDVSTLTGAYVLQHAPVIDVVAWGSPCQDLSVAGKRAGLKGERSGLFHEGIRIIKEIRELTNGKYPRMSVWENVAGALSSGAGADFGQVLYEMDEAGACFSEWRLLDAQYFGVPQRRRRVFVVSVFDPATAERCPNPLLPVSEGVRWNPSQGRTARETTTGTSQEGFGNSGFQRWTETDTAVTLSARDHKSSNTMVVGTLAARDYKGVGNQYVNEGKLVVEPFVKAKRAQSASDDETWVEGDINPTINQFDQGDVRATTVVVGSLQARDYKGTNHEGARDGKLVVESSPSHSVANTLRVGSGVGERGDGTDNLVTAIVIREREGKAGGGKGPLYGEEKSHSLIASNDQKLFVEAVAYDEYNDRLGGQVHHALRAGTKQSTGVAISEVVGTLRSGGDGGVPSSRGEHLVVSEAAGFKPGASANAHSIGYEEGLSPSLEAGGGGNNRPAVLEPTMSVRRLTPLECERLMGWPDDWTAGQADTHRYKQCGNGVASPVAQWIGEQIINL